MSKIVTRATIEELTWQDVRKEVAEKNPVLANIIDDINPNSEYTLFKASYPFGSEILKEGHLFIPNRYGDLVPLASEEIPAAVQRKLNYNLGSNPVSFVLKNTAELFMILENNTIPFYGFISPGKIFSTWYVLSSSWRSHHPVFLWNITAGVRSIFMLPKISEVAGYNRLRREFHLQTEKPKHLLDHWKIFREITQYAEVPWSLEVLFFSRKWFEQFEEKKWRELKCYLLEIAWRSSEFFRNQFVWNLAFSIIQKQRRIKPNPYIADTVKHLLAMGIGALPGFAPALDNQSAPIEFLQEVFSTVYQLNNYTPVIMQATFFSSDEQRPIYYSLQYPTTMEFSPRSREDATKVFNLYETQSLLNKYLIDLQSGMLNIKETPLYDLPHKVRYDFFHTNVENYTNFRANNQIPLEDVSFNQALGGKVKKFPVNSTFLRGCIRIMAKQLVEHR